MNSVSAPYNARHISAKEVAESFVVPDKFFNIATFENSLLIGPRGSGKTTILKALTPTGLHYLNMRDDLKRQLSELRVDYLPVYIPAESSWKGDALAISEAIETPAERNHILNGLFVDHALRWVILALEESRRLADLFSQADRPPWCIPIDQNVEMFISRHLSEAWKIERTQNSFIGLKLALIDRSNSFRAPITCPGDGVLKGTERLPRLDLLQMFRATIEVVEENSLNTKWSFNFDEMEIAPKHVVSTLYENLRSWDQRAVLKFSLFPYVDFYSLDQKRQSSEKGPVDGQDFQTFLLTNDFAKNESRFSIDLIKSACERQGLSILDLSQYLNSSDAIQRDTRKYNGLRFERNFQKIFNRPFQAKSDPSFIQFLDDRGFKSAEELSSLQGENARARNIRKIAPICEFRNYYLSERRASKSKGSRRTSPKGFGYYHGFNQILALSEGNPRTILFYINELVDAFRRGEKSSIAQNRVISRNVDRFRALIASQVVPAEDQASGIENALHLADRLGALFTQEVLGQKFKPEPRLSVIFKQIPDQTKRTIEVAINSGAFIVDNSHNETKLIFDVEKRRVRLSHSFAPFYPLPTFTGEPMTLNEIPPTEAFRADQADLFRWTD